VLPAPAVRIVTSAHGVTMSDLRIVCRAVDVAHIADAGRARDANIAFCLFICSFHEDQQVVNDE
jgi:hypothetical protein